MYVLCLWLICCEMSFAAYNERPVDQHRFWGRQVETVRRTVGRNRSEAHRYVGCNSKFLYDLFFDIAKGQDVLTVTTQATRKNICRLPACPKKCWNCPLFPKKSLKSYYICMKKSCIYFKIMCFLSWCTMVQLGLRVVGHLAVTDFHLEDPSVLCIKHYGFYVI